MKAIKVVEIRKLYSVMFDQKMISETMGKVNKSLSVVEVYDNDMDKTHFSEWHGVTNTLDLLPNGTLYLADDFEEAIEKLGKRYS